MMHKGREINQSKLADCGVTQSYFYSRYFECVAAHGREPQDKKTACSHEAGHLVFGMAADFGIQPKFKTCSVIELAPSCWGGFTEVVKFNRPCIPIIHHDMALSQAGNSYAGIAGEALSGRFHPASSMDERIITEVFANQFSSDGRALRVIQEYVNLVLNENHELFSKVEARLLTYGRISKGWLKKQEVVKVDAQPFVESLTGLLEWWGEDEA